MGTEFLGAVSALGSLMSGIATTFFLIQLSLIRRQMTKTEEWNRKNAGIVLLMNDRLAAYETDAAKALKSLGVNLYQLCAPLTEEQVSNIMYGDDLEKYRALKGILNVLESQAASVFDGTLDAKQMYNLKRDQVCRYFTILEPLIYATRRHCQNPNIWKSIEKLANSYDNPYKTCSGAIDKPRADVGICNSQPINVASE